MPNVNDLATTSPAGASWIGMNWNGRTAIRGRPQPDYAGWSIEELRAFAVQLQLPGAGHQTRRELLRLLGVGSSS